MLNLSQLAGPICAHVHARPGSDSGDSNGVVKYQNVLVKLW